MKDNKQEQAKSTKRKLDDLDDTSSLVPQNLKKLKSNAGVVKPSYIVNMPIKVDSDSESETSDGEERNETFPKKYFAAPLNYFRLSPVGKSHKRKRGKVSDQDVTLKTDQKSYADDHPSVNSVNRLVKIFTDESFGESPDISQPIAQNRLSMSLGLNKMRSLSRTRNQSLSTLLAAPITTTVPIKKVAYFWDAPWQEKQAKKWVDVDYQRVHAFYRQLKSHNNDMAITFRRTLEAGRGHAVPYREIRDRLKNHENTKTLVKSARSSNPSQPAFLGFFDSDTQSLRANRLGTFSIFDQEIAKNPDLEVASVGYMVQDPNNPLIEIGVQFDLNVRHATAKYIKNGIYYPEPCTIVKIPANKNTVEENFTIANDYHYSTPKEMPILIQSILAERKLNAQKTMAFNMDGAIVTTKPTRMQRTFSAIKNQNDKVILWSLDDFKTIKGMSQTHAMSRDWASYVINALPVKSFDNFTVNEVKNILISLISRVYKAFDPIAIAKKMQDTSSFPVSFQRCLIYTIDIYDREKLLNQAIKVEKIPGRTNNTAYWEKIDNIDNLKQLKIEIDSILDKIGSPIRVGHIENAAYWSNAAIVSVIRNQFCLNHEKLSLELLKYFFEQHEEVSQGYEGNETEEISELYRMILEDRILDEKTKAIDLLKAMEEPELGPYNTTPLHWAAITGNKKIINWLISKKNDSKIGWVGDISQYADFNISPLHCGLKYCAFNGIDLDVIKPLCNDETISAATEELEFTPLILALKEVTKPAAIVAYLCKRGANVDGEDQVYDENLTYPIFYAVANNDEESVKILLEYDPILSDITDLEEKPLLFVARNNASMDIFKRLVAAGADVNEQDESEETFLLHDSISSLYGGSRAHYEMFDFLLENGAHIESCDGADETPLQIALVSEDKTIIKKLYDAGAQTHYLSRDEMATLRAATREELYNSSEEESMEEEDTRKTVSHFVKSQSGFIQHPRTQEEEFNNDLLRATFDPHFDYELSSDSEIKEESSESSQSESEALSEDDSLDNLMGDAAHSEEENNRSLSEDDMLIDDRDTSPRQGWF